MSKSKEMLDDKDDLDPNSGRIVVCSSQVLYFYIFRKPFNINCELLRIYKDTQTHTHIHTRPTHIRTYIHTYILSNVIGGGRYRIYLCQNLF